MSRLNNKLKIDERCIVCGQQFGHFDHEYNCLAEFITEDEKSIEVPVCDECLLNCNLLGGFAVADMCEGCGACDNDWRDVELYESLFFKLKEVGKNVHTVTCKITGNTKEYSPTLLNVIEERSVGIPSLTDEPRPKKMRE